MPVKDSIAMHSLLALKYMWAAVRLALIILNNLYCIPTHCIWLTLLTPLRKYAPVIYYRIEGYLFSWLLAMVSLWSWSAGYQIVEQGDDIARCLDKRTLVVANHQSTADVPMLMAALNAKPGVLNHIMWIMDRMFRYTNFGVVSSFHRDFFIASGKARRDESVRQLEAHLKSEYVPLGRKWMILFPEGGFLTKRRPVSQRFAEKNNLPLLHNVTMPRMGALYVIRDTLMREQDKSPHLLNEIHSRDNNCRDENGNREIFKEHKLEQEHKETEQQQKNGKEPNGSLFKDVPGEYSKAAVPVDAELEYILDITIGYPNGQPLNLLHIATALREPCETVLYYRLYSTKDIPRDDSNLSRWMYDRFIEKESLLEHFYKNKTFPKESAMPTRKMEENGTEIKELPIRRDDEKPANGKLVTNGGNGVELSDLRSGLEAEGHTGDEGSYLVQQDLLRFVILHIFFITSSYFHYRIFTTIFHNCLSLYAMIL